MTITNRYVPASLGNEDAHGWACDYLYLSKFFNKKTFEKMSKPNFKHQVNNSKGYWRLIETKTLKKLGLQDPNNNLEISNCISFDLDHDLLK